MSPGHRHTSNESITLKMCLTKNISKYVGQFLHHLTQAIAPMNIRNKIKKICKKMDRGKWMGSPTKIRMYLIATMFSLDFGRCFTDFY